MSIGMYDVEESHDIWVIHLFEQGNFADGCAGYSFIFGFETNLLQSYNAARIHKVASFVDNSIGTFTISQ